MVHGAAAVGAQGGAGAARWRDDGTRGLKDTWRCLGSEPEGQGAFANACCIYPYVQIYICNAQMLCKCPVLVPAHCGCLPQAVTGTPTSVPRVQRVLLVKPLQPTVLTLPLTPSCRQMCQFGKPGLLPSFPSSLPPCQHKAASRTRRFQSFLFQQSRSTAGKCPGCFMLGARGRELQSAALCAPCWSSAGFPRARSAWQELCVPQVPAH